MKKHSFTRTALVAFGLLAVSSTGTLRAQDPWVVYDGGAGPLKGKHVVLISGDEEYRSEEALPQLGKILAKHHGCKCTVLFAIDPKDGTINPNQNDNIPGLEALQSADLMIIFTRFRNLPDAQMQHIAKYLEAGKPIIGMRTATHAFNNPKSKLFAKHSHQSKEWAGGFGKQVLGETWVNHHGGHGTQSTRGILAKGAEKNPILRGIKDGDIWGPTDVYTVRLASDCTPLVMGEVLKGMKSTDEPLPGPKNNPMMPVAWTRIYEGEQGVKSRVFTTTMGASQDLAAAGTRRLLVNAAYWALALEEQIPAMSQVDIVGTYKPLPFGNNKFVKGLKPADLK